MDSSKTSVKNKRAKEGENDWHPGRVDKIRLPAKFLHTNWGRSIQSSICRITKDKEVPLGNLEKVCKLAQIKIRLTAVEIDAPFLAQSHEESRPLALVSRQLSVYARSQNSRACKNPDISADILSSNPMLYENMVVFFISKFD